MIRSLFRSSISSFKSTEKILINKCLRIPLNNSLKPISTTNFLCQDKPTTTTTPTPTSSGNNPLSTNKNLFFVEHVKEKKYVIFRLNRAPVNSLNLDFLTELNIQLDKFEQSNDINGVILTSHIPHIFSAGLDIMEMYQIKSDRGRQFWNTLQDFWLKLYGSNKIYIAAINGHSPAGGCLTAMACDYRIMAKGPYKIGLNETQLGITAPFWFKENMVNTIGHRETEKALQLGLLYSVDEALRIHLIDEIANDDKDLMDRAEKQLLQWSKIPTAARQLTKTMMRRDLINKLISQRESDTDTFIDFAMKDFVQKSLQTYLEALKKPRNK